MSKRKKKEEPLNGDNNSNTNTKLIDVLEKDFEALWDIQNPLSGDPLLNANIKNTALFFYIQGIGRSAKFIDTGE
ncbi:MAG: hypothetical protein WC375_09850 [Methanomassiliicoccales archaeon]|jgi:hypothetical protein